ncbi:hypothetical protein K491DRAFT_685128 [Lophiostoma macrostomum CBS 122681]|uniref:Uncharacterized protein n=1 Tax=Lophiostoma macrostomum CBS 122681 TaxID=1314788 RepID=A0A6A6SJC3_9PLEO|nr:hypothetical protein K491DRAFT_685128 [Lophiostoma macrostomum CBS 122681]
MALSSASSERSRPLKRKNMADSITPVPAPKRRAQRSSINDKDPEVEQYAQNVSSPRKSMPIDVPECPFKTAFITTRRVLHHANERRVHDHACDHPREVQPPLVYNDVKAIRDWPLGIVLSTFMEEIEWKMHAQRCHGAQASTSDIAEPRTLDDFRLAIMSPSREFSLALTFLPRDVTTEEQRSAESPFFVPPVLTVAPSHRKSRPDIDRTGNTQMNSARPHSSPDLSTLRQAHDARDRHAGEQQHPPHESSHLTHTDSPTSDTLQGKIHYEGHDGYPTPPEGQTPPASVSTSGADSFSHLQDAKEGRSLTDKPLLPPSPSIDNQLYQGGVATATQPLLNSNYSYPYTYVQWYPGSNPGQLGVSPYPLYHYTDAGPYSGYNSIQAYQPEFPGPDPNIDNAGLYASSYPAINLESVPMAGHSDFLNCQIIHPGSTPHASHWSYLHNPGQGAPPFTP